MSDILNIDFARNSMYDDYDTSNGGESMTNTKDTLTAILKAVGYTQADAARAFGWTPVQLNAKLNNKSLKTEEFLGIIDELGVDVHFTIRETGKKIRVPAYGYGRQIRGMVNGTIYDTSKSEVLSNSFYADGVNEYTNGNALELYVDKKGNYFFVEYSSFESAKDRIIPTDANSAAEFIEKFGTEIFKKPNE